MPQILASKMSLFGMPMVPAMKRVRDAGFDGIEVLINGIFKTNICQYDTLAHELGLSIHFHQAWSADEDSTDKTFWILEKVGYLPKEGYTLRDHLPLCVNVQIVVVNADRIAERFTDNQWIQTDCVFKNGCPSVPFEEFVRKANDESLPVVFDTQHYLEYRLGHFRDLRKLPTDRDNLLKLLSEGWEMLGHLTREIHLNDWIPEGRNVFPGTGVAPLKEFCQLVKSTGWNGYVVPEISPSLPIPHSRSTLKRLRMVIESYF